MTSFPGQLGLPDTNSEVDLINFIVRQALGRIGTIKVVKVTALKGGGGALAAPGMVSIQPLVNQLDGTGQATPNGLVHNVPYIRAQGGKNAIISDPVVGDIGIAFIADRDISAVKASKAQANPGSYRRFDMADAIYLGGMLNGVPNQTIQFTDTGLTIADMNGNSIVTGPAGVNINGLIIDKDGNLTTPGSAQAGTGGADSVTLQHHTHGGGPAPDEGT